MLSVQAPRVPRAVRVCQQFCLGLEINKPIMGENERNERVPALAVMMTGV